MSPLAKTSRKVLKVLAFFGSNLGIVLVMGYFVNGIGCDCGGEADIPVTIVACTGDSIKFKNGKAPSTDTLSGAPIAGESNDRPITCPPSEIDLDDLAKLNDQKKADYASKSASNVPSTVPPTISACCDPNSCFLKIKPDVKNNHLPSKDGDSKDFNPSIPVAEQCNPILYTNVASTYEVGKMHTDAANTDNVHTGDQVGWGPGNKPVPSSSPGGSRGFDYAQGHRSWATAGGTLETSHPDSGKTGNASGSDSGLGQRNPSAILGGAGGGSIGSQGGMPGLGSGEGTAPATTTPAPGIGSEMSAATGAIAPGGTGFGGMQGELTQGGAGASIGHGTSVGGTPKTTAVGFGDSNEAGELNPMLSQDPEDYFTRIGLGDDLFKAISKHYMSKAMVWVTLDTHPIPSSLPSLVPFSRPSSHPSSRP